MIINWTTDKMKIVEELSKSIKISTINKLQKVSHLVNLVSVACFVINPLSDIRVTIIYLIASTVSVYAKSTNYLINQLITCLCLSRRFP